LVKRNESLGIFILDALVAAGRELKDRKLAAYDKFKANLDKRADPDLVTPFNDAQKKAKEWNGFSDDLAAIKAHVENVRELYQKHWATTSPSKPSGSKGKRAGNRKDRDAGLADITRQFVEGPINCRGFNKHQVAAIKASYAYTRSVAFGFSMAWIDLCAIKAEASKHVPTARSFSEAMSIGPSFVRVVGENRGE